MKALLLSFALFIVAPLSQAVASDGACCACQTGTYPENQVPFFVAGCQMWLATHNNCDQRMIVPQEGGLDNIPQSCDGKLLKLGFVGHWGGAGQSARFLRTSFEEGVVKRGMSMQIDNTACSGMDRPHIVEKELNDREFPQDKYISFKASQVLSVGMWDPILLGESNFFAIYDSRLKKTIYPACKSYQNKGCTGLVGLQIGEQAYCQAEKGELRELTCCNLQVEVNTLQGGKDGGRTVKKLVTGAFWATRETCNRGSF